MKYSLKADGAERLTRALTVGDFLRLDAYKSYAAAAATLATLDEVIIDPKLIGLINGLEMIWGDGCEITLTPHGGYRPETLNRVVGGAKGSQHRYGRAADIYVRINGNVLDVPTAATAAENYMFKNGIAGGVGVYAAQNKYFHVDVRGSWAAWFCSYNGRNCPAQGGRPTTFKRGHRAAGIILIQRKLNAMGYNCGAEDGIFGKRTETAVIKYQNANRLIADGIFGKRTNAALQIFEW